MPEKNDKWTIIEGPDEEGFYTAYNEDSKYAHLKADRKTPLYPQRYDDIGTFQEGFAVVQDGDYGYHIKPDGSPAYEMRYEGVVQSFEDGRADVYTLPNNLVLVVRDGEVFEEE